jgi:hypothetical protein
MRFDSYCTEMGLPAVEVELALAEMDQQQQAHNLRQASIASQRCPPAGVDTTNAAAAAGAGMANPKAEAEGTQTPSE